MMCMENFIMIIYQGETYGNNERPIGVWSTLRTPNKKMESKNEEIHLWREKKHLYY